MKTLAKRLTAAAMAAVMAASMAVNAGAACTQHGRYSTAPRGEIYRYYERHMHEVPTDDGGTGFVACTIVTEKREIVTTCGICYTVISSIMSKVGYRHNHASVITKY